MSEDNKEGEIDIADEWLRSAEQHAADGVNGHTLNGSNGLLNEHGNSGPAAVEPDPVYALNRQRVEKLAELDSARFMFFHLRVAMVAGVGFFTDAYDIFAVNIGAYMIAYVYNGNPFVPAGDYKGDVILVPYSSNEYLALTISSSVGNVIGMLLFGWLADKLGRKRMYGVELIIIMIGCFGQAVSDGRHNADSTDHAINIYGVLVLWRFIMGVGIGGDYPMSAVLASELSPTYSRGRIMTVVAAAQGWGTFTAALVGLILVSAGRDGAPSGTSGNITRTTIRLDVMWRILIALGCIPAVIGFFFRLTMPETPRFTMDIARNVQQATWDIDNIVKDRRYRRFPDAVIQRVQVRSASWSDFVIYFATKKNALLLFGAAWAWFAADIAFYGLNLNSSVLLGDIGFRGTTMDLYTNLANICKGNIILTLAGQIPGFYLTYALIDLDRPIRIFGLKLFPSWGRKPIQLIGFTMLTVLFVIMGFGYNTFASGKGGKVVFVLLYCLANVFSNFGPNVTAFIFPGESFPTRYRSTGHGFCAAAGKLGAIVAQLVFWGFKLDTASGPNPQHALETFALFTLTGVFTTIFLMPETRGRSLEELSNEEQYDFIEGVALVEMRNGVAIPDGVA